MSDQAKKLSDEARKLTPAEKLKVVDDILDSLDETDESIDLLWDKEVEDRIRAYRRGELKSVDLDEILDKYRTG
jgi:putative addiction module component (TIGR02574 family)